MLIKIFYYYYFINHISFKHARGAPRMPHRRFLLDAGGEQIDCKLIIIKIKLTTTKIYGLNYLSP